MMDNNENNTTKIQPVESERQIAVPETLPVLPRNDVILYPLLILPIAVVEANNIKLIDDALTGSKLIFVGYTRSTDTTSVKNENIEKFGVVANIMKMLRFPDGSIRILIQGIKRAKIASFDNSDKPYPIAKIQVIE